MWRRIPVLVRCLALTVLGSPALAEDALHHFDIQTQSTASALNEFARQANITLVFSSLLVAKHQTVGVRGNFTLQGALQKILEGSGLSFKQVGVTTIAIDSDDRTEMMQRPPAGTPTVGTAPDTDNRQSKGDETMNHRGLFTRIAGLFALSGAVLTAGHAQAQDAAADTSAADASTANTSTLDEIVVTGTPQAAGLKKLDASFSITTASLEEIRTANPSSAADLLKIVPGLFAESSGGETGANIELAGYPGGGDAPYVTYQLNGSPIFPVPTLSFMDNSSLFRIDESIERAEVVLGGPAVVFSNGQIGATANFVLRQGSATPHGDIAVTFGSEGMYRFDGFYSGQIAPDWFMSVGGFYRDSNGVRSPEFPSDIGGQLTATLSHNLDNGTIMFYARVLDDKNLFITDVPLTVSADGKHVSAFPGFDPLKGTFAGNALRGLQVQEFPGSTPGTITADLADGRGADIHVFGSDLDLDLGAWKLSNKFSFTGGDVPTNALFNNLSPQTIDAFKAGEVTTANGTPAVLAAAGGVAATGGTATYVNGGGVVAPGTQVASVGFWVVDKKIQAFTDDLRFSTDLFEGDSLTVGGYFTSYSSDDTWYLGNNLLITATPNAQLINLTLDNGAVATRNGQLGGSTFSLVDNFDGRNVALFASDSWKFGPWLFDAGYRLENEHINGSIENDDSVDLDANPLTLYNNGVSVANGTFTSVHYDHTLGSWTLGGNYEVTPHMSVFARYNEGFHLPSFDDLRNGQPQSQHIDNAEIGYRAQTATVYGVLDVFRRQFSGVPFQQFLEDGSSFTATYGSMAYGVGFEGKYQPIDQLSFALTGDWQHAQYRGFTGNATNDDILQRQPKLQFRFTPEYHMPVPWGDFRVFTTYSYIGQRYSDPGNTQVLPKYYTLDAGVVTGIGNNVEIRLQGSNLTNQIGLTEGNARIQTAGIAGGFEMARPIFGREGQIQLRYKF
jgi:outer membrane receptor protein involved in Fe transport